jgi:hypothetical protein
MLTHDEALVHARQHLYCTTPPVEWVWVLNPGRRVSAGWFFHYCLQPLRFIRDHEGPQFGGAPGFLVSDDGTVRNIGWQAYGLLFPNNGPDAGGVEAR